VDVGQDRDPHALTSIHEGDDGIRCDANLTAGSSPCNATLARWQVENVDPTVLVQRWVRERPRAS
jgi:hypothetical protein